MIEEYIQNEPKNSMVLNKGVDPFQKSLWPKLKIVTHMNLSRCNITALPEAMCDLVSLQFFQASHNLLTHLPASVGLLKSLTKLILPFNKLSTLPSAFAELDALEYLVLSHNAFKEVPKCLQQGNIKINYLDISFNQLEDWSNGPLCGFALTFLNCSHNSLKTNPSWLWGDFCRSLEDLDLSFNSFTNMSFMVKTYTSWRTGVTVRLRRLSLCQSGLSSNHVSLLHQLKAVEKLNIGNSKKEDSMKFPQKHSSYNFLWQLSFKQFQSTGALTDLCLCATSLASLPDDIDCLEVLEILDCQENELQWLPETFSKLSKLRIAKFSYNKLLYLPDDFGKLSSLEELWLDSNEIGELPLSCSDLQKLKWLDLYSNNLEDLPSCLFTILTNLDGLDLENNHFDLKSSVNERVEFSPNLIKTLKDALRRYAQTCRGNKIIRHDGLKPTNVDNHYSSDSNRSSYCESSASEEYSADVGENTVCAETLENENWDLEEGVDDYFDPTCVQSRIIINMPARALIINELVLRPGSFCPSDIHPSPSIRAIKDPFAPKEGQFDDA